MTYYLYAQQKGEGCDYTIGCAQAIYRLKATCLEELAADVKQVFDEYGLAGEKELAELKVFELIETPVMGWYRDFLGERAITAEQRRKDAQRAELARLKAELGED